MIRITDQYFWNVVFTVFFGTLVVLAAVILETEAYRPLAEFGLIDFLIISLASFRLIRLFVYDAVTKWFREQFWDAEEKRGQVVLQKPTSGPRRTLADLFSCPWCFGMWTSASVTFFYALTPYAYFIAVFLAISSIASLLQIFANMIGHRAEQLKNQNERGY